MESNRCCKVITSVLLLFGGVAVVAGTFGGREPPTQALLEAQTVCVKYLGICEERLAQYNNSIYPSDRDTMRMVRCAGIMLGFWEDGEGLLLDGLVALHPPLADDAGARRQILSCAERRLASCMPEDTCAKAFNGFHCFLEAKRSDFAAGAPSSQKPCDREPPAQFSGADFMKSLLVCTKILRVPANLAQLYRRGVFPNDEKTQCVIRCVGIRNELYDDERGPNLAVLYGQFGGGQSEADFRRRAAICMDANQPLLARPQNKCAEAYRKLYLCFKDAFGALTRANANAV